MIKNLDNIELWELGNTGSEASGKTWEQIKVTSNYRIRTKNLIKCPSTLNLYLSSDYHLDLLWFDENGLMISSPLASGWIKGLNGVRLDISVPSEAKLMGILIKKDNNGEITLSDIGYTNFYSFEDNESSIPSNIIISNNINTIFIGEILASKMYIGSSLIWTSLNLPDNCVEIEYLESDGNQWIDTRFIYKVSPKIVTTILTRADEDADLFGSNTSTVPCWIGNFKINESWYRWGRDSSINVSAFPNGINTWTNWDIGLNIIVDGSQLYHCDDYDFSSNLNSVYLFRGRPGNPKAKCAYKEVKLYDGNTLIRDFIPVRIGQVGYMYDKISKQLFTNQGTGNFILGPDKVLLPSEYTQLEYIESTGTQWIDTGYKSNNVDSFELIITTNGTTEYMGSNGNLQVDLSINSNLGKRTIKVTHSANDGPKTYVNDSLVKTEGFHTYNGFIIALFAMGNNGFLPIVSHYSLAAVYSSQLIINNTLVRNLIPARRNSDNVLGMYDIVTGNFLTNQGTGDFVAGPNK